MTFCAVEGTAAGFSPIPGSLISRSALPAVWVSDVCFPLALWNPVSHVGRDGNFVNSVPRRARNLRHSAFSAVCGFPLSFPPCTPCSVVSSGCLPSAVRLCQVFFQAPAWGTDDADPLCCRACTCSFECESLICFRFMVRIHLLGECFVFVFCFSSFFYLKSQS